MIKSKNNLFLLISIIITFICILIIAVVKPKKLMIKDKIDKKNTILISTVIGFSFFCLLCIFVKKEKLVEISTFKFNY